MPPEQNLQAGRVMAPTSDGRDYETSGQIPKYSESLKNKTYGKQ